MKKSKILSILLALLISMSIFSGVFGCNCSGKESFTVTFVGGEGAVLVSGKAVQTVTDASQIQPPVFERPGYGFDSWSLIILDIKESTTVKAVWYSGYKVVLSRKYVDYERNGKTVVVGYDTRRGDTFKIPYGSRLGAKGTLFPFAESMDGDYEFLRWNLVLDNGKVIALNEETTFNDELFVTFGMTEEQAFNQRGKSLNIKPIMKFIGKYS